METCTRCRISGNEVRLFDAVYEGRMELLCERCSIIENAPIIKKPDSSQLKESEETIGVYDRMKQLAGIRDQEQEETYFQEDKLKKLDEQPELEQPEKEKLNLVDHFHWEIMKNRRRKGLSPQQLAETLGESEIVIQMIEKGKLPENPEPLIRKLEQFFQTKLRKIPETERILQQKQTEPTLLDEDGFELDIIPEEEPYIPPKEEIEEPTIKEEMLSETQQPPKPYINESQDLDLKKIDTSKVTIEQLKQLHEKKMEMLKQKEEEEKRKQEERKRILEELKEQDRIKREQARQTALLEKQKLEQERLKAIEQKKQEIEQKRRKEADEIDRLLGGSELLEDKPDYQNNEELI